MKHVILFYFLSVFFASIVYAGGPDCTKVKADVKTVVTAYMTKYLGFPSGEGVKIECPGGIESKSFEWEELMGKNAPNDVFTAEGKAITPQAAGGGYYEIYYRVSYTKWHNYSKNELSDTWKFSWANTTHYVPYNVPGEELTNEEKEKCFLDYIEIPENRSKFSRIQDYIKVNDLKALAKVTSISPDKKEILLVISGEKIKNANDGDYFDLPLDYGVLPVRDWPTDKLVNFFYYLSKDAKAYQIFSWQGENKLGAAKELVIDLHLTPVIDKIGL